jgi:hypothetical protein
MRTSWLQDAIYPCLAMPLARLLRVRSGSRREISQGQLLTPQRIFRNNAGCESRQPALLKLRRFTEIADYAAPHLAGLVRGARRRSHDASARGREAGVLSASPRFREVPEADNQPDAHSGSPAFRSPVTKVSRSSGRRSTTHSATCEMRRLGSSRRTCCMARRASSIRPASA